MYIKSTKINFGSNNIIYKNILDCASQLTPINVQESWNIQGTFLNNFNVNSCKIFLSFIYTYEIANDITETLNQIKRMVAISNVTLRNNTERLRKLEDAIRSHILQQPMQNDDNYIAEFFPLKIIDDITNIENILKSNEEAVTQFVSFYIIVYILYLLVILVYISL